MKHVQQTITMSAYLVPLRKYLLLFSCFISNHFVNLIMSVLFFYELQILVNVSVSQCKIITICVVFMYLSVLSGVRRKTLIIPPIVYAKIVNFSYDKFSCLIKLVPNNDSSAHDKLLSDQIDN